MNVQSVNIFIIQKHGNEKAGIKPGTAFEDLPDDWVCPVCGEGKDMFEMHQQSQNIEQKKKLQLCNFFFCKVHE